jgi:phage-related protein
VRLIAEPGELTAGLRAATAETESFGSHLKSSLGAAMKGIAVVGVGTAIVIDRISKAAMDAQAEQARLAQSFKNAGLSAKAYAGQVDQVEAAGRKLGFTNAEIGSSLGSLITATKSVHASMKDLSVAEDLARFKGIDLESASKMMTQAMTGSQRAAKQLGITVVPVTTNLDALKASHVNLTTASGRLLEAHAKLLDKMATGKAVVDEVSKRVAGQGEAFAGTAAGGMLQFHSELNNLEASMGTALLPTIGKTATALADLINWLQNSATAHHIASVAVADLKAAFEAVKPALALLVEGMKNAVDYIRQNWPQIKATVLEVMNAVRDIITAVVSVVEAIWQRFGSTIVSIVSINFHVVVTVIKDVFDVIVATFKLVGDLLHGRWSKVWDDIKTIVSHALDAVVTVLRGMVQTFFKVAEAVGKALIDGIVAGVTGLAGKIGDALSNAVHGALDSVKHGFGIFSPSTVTSVEIGQPLADGIIQGFLLGTASLPAKVNATITAALTAAKATIDAGRASLQTAWGQLGTDVGSAFDAIAAKIQTPMEKLIARQTAQRNMAQLKDTLTAAQAGLVTAQAGGDPAQIAAATKAVEDAKYQITLVGEQKIAAQQRLQLDAKLALERRHLETSLAQLETNLEKQGASHAESQKRIIGLLNSYGISYKTSGLALGNAFAEGIRESIGAAVKAAQELADAVSRYLPHSLAKEGPLSVPVNWNALMPAFDLNAARGTMAMAFAGTGRGATGGTIHTHVYLDKREIATAVQQWAARDVRNGGSGIPGR